MVLVIIFATVAILIVTLCACIELPVRRLKKLTYRIPGPKGLEAWTNTTTDIFEYFQQNKEHYGSVLRLPGFGYVMIMISDVEDIEVMFKTAELIVKPTELIKYIKPWLGDGLIFSNGPYWKQQRKLITPTFHFAVLEKFFEVFNEQSEILINVLKEKADGKSNFDIFPIMQSFAFDVICETAMGAKMNMQSKPNEHYYMTAVTEMQRIYMERQYKFFQRSDFLFSFTRNGRIQRKSLKIIRGTCDEIICKRRKDLVGQSSSNSLNMDDNSMGIKRHLALLDLLLQARNPDGTRLTNKQITDEVQTFTVACGAFILKGHNMAEQPFSRCRNLEKNLDPNRLEARGFDTTSTQLSLLLYHLSKHPHIQEEIFKEQCEILMGENRPPTFKEVQELQYLDRTIKESQRFANIVSYIVRYVHKDITLKTNGYVVPKGAFLVGYLTALHQNPNIYPNPEKFDPDRFLPENVKKRNPFAFLPFGAGARNCIGQKFAMIEMKLTASKIIKNFKILPAYEDDGTPFEPVLKTYIVLTAVNGIKIRLTPRN